LNVYEIFTPNDTPTVTYVNRSGHKLEQQLRQAYETANQIVSVSGPSKSGKTVLIKKVVPEDCLIPIIGASITSAENLWERVLNWTGAPELTTVAQSATNQASGGVEVGGKAKIPFVAEGGAKATAGGSRSWGTTTSETRHRGGLDQVIKDIAKTEYVVFIDDFHYIKAEIREDIGKQIKAAAENGVKIFTASVPHRADDAVRSNPELRGRVAAVNLEYWSAEEIIQIPRKGFAALNSELAPAVESRFATEAFGSPQLMQSICLNLCHDLQLAEELPTQARLAVSDQEVVRTLQRTSSVADFSKLVSALHIGPRTRGTERKIHDFTDSTRGDVYRAVLLAMKNDPAALSIPYDAMLDRVRAVCTADAPVGSSVTSALEQMNVIAEEVQPGKSPLSWDDDTLDIVDPYLLFFLRCSEKLTQLGSKT
jgi:molybdopterin-guanine dinucleotide biosynthesis protein